MTNDSRLNDIYEKYRELLRIKEKLLLRRNVPYLMIISCESKLIYSRNIFFVFQILDADKICDINCTLHMLLNAPVFIQLIRKLQRLSERNITNLQSIQNISPRDNDIQIKRDLFSNLGKIVKIIFEENSTINTDILLLLKLLREKYQTSYSCMNDWNVQDSDEFYINWMNILQLVAKDMNQMELYSNSFELITTNGEEFEAKKDYIIHFLSNSGDFTDIIASRTFNYNSLLPKQIFAIPDRDQNGGYFSYPYPSEFVTRYNQRYLFTSAIIRNITCVNCENNNVVIRRQDSVYLFNNYRLINRFHIDDLPEFFNRVRFI